MSSVAQLTLGLGTAILVKRPFCKRAGVTVHYCAEQFENDGSPVSTIVKGVKRAMAGEYSRELSAKVFAGQCRLIELGFSCRRATFCMQCFVWETISKNWKYALPT